MGQPQQLPMTSEEYLAWKARQEFKWEFDGFQPVAMVGGTAAHSTIRINLVTALNIRLRGTPCQPYGDKLKVRIGPKYRYPDALVSCTEFANTDTVAAEPVVIFEIPSTSTSDTDKTAKLAEYLSLPSVQRYVMLEQNRIFATIVTRTSDGWGLALTAEGGTLTMPEIGIEVPMAELYNRLTFPPEGGAHEDGAHKDGAHKDGAPDR